METTARCVSTRQSQPIFSASAVVAAKPISEVWVALGGDPPRGGRARAFYRDGANNHAVALSDAKGAWFDHRDGCGGGVLDLVQRVLGYSRADALRWLADLAGMPLADRPMDAADRRRYVRARGEAVEIVAWRERLTDALKRERTRWWSIYHATLSYVLQSGFGSPFSGAMATLHELSESQVNGLEKQIEILAAAHFSDLLPIFREQNDRRAA